MARGGVAGSSHYVGNWAGDTLAVESEPGLLSAVHALLSEAMSGQPIWASDIGGYSGRSAGQIPTAATFVRWTQFGAVSPIMESPNHPSDYDAATVAASRKAAVLHDRLAPYTAAAAKRATATGVPIAQPLVLAYPDDTAAPLIDDEYVFDGCLLAAPITTGIETESAAARAVYLPAGTWTNVFTGKTLVGPTATTEVSAYDEFPLYRSSSCAIPMSVFKGL
jgi:alpha-D-xyloside xylohydrolase